MITLSTPRLILRPWSDLDIDPLFRIMTEKDILQYFPQNGPITRERVESLVANRINHWDKRGYGWWALEDKDGGEFIGWCGLLFLPETGEVEVGYLLKSSCWGRGLATEATQASLDYGFDEHGMDRIIGIVHPENKASQRVLEKTGMKFVDRNVYFGMACFRYEKTREMHISKSKGKKKEVPKNLF